MQTRRVNGQSIPGRVRICLLEVQPDGSIKECGEGVPGSGHSDGDREGDGREDKSRHFLLARSLVKSYRKNPVEKQKLACV
jgi:hypothetical protein